MITDQIKSAREGFISLNLDNELIEEALRNLTYWLEHKEFQDYWYEIDWLIQNKKYEELFDSFFRIIPFGTGGRRGKVGIGPNRINHWTIASSAQGHSQFLIQKYGEQCKSRGIVIAYDVRYYESSKQLSHSILDGITSRKLAEIAASIYIQNGFKIYFFDKVCPTPMLSFAIRHLNSISGINISASHNPIDNNGKKIYGPNGAQLLPPDDQELADEITNNVEIHKCMWEEFNKHLDENAIHFIDEQIDREYFENVKNLLVNHDYNKSKKSRTLYSALHGTGVRNIYIPLKKLGFDIIIDETTSVADGTFKTLTNITPNPENPEVYDMLFAKAETLEVDIILTSDPDADRMGMNVKHNNKWHYLDGNHVALLCSQYLINKWAEYKQTTKGQATLLSTVTVTRLVKEICQQHGVQCNDRIIPGFKYLAEAMDKIESEGKIDNLLIAFEDTLGHLAGNYARDKDGLIASLFLMAYADELKNQEQTLVDALNIIHSKYGYYLNSTTGIGFRHAYEMYKVDKLMNKLRLEKQIIVGELKATLIDDFWEKSPILTPTDRSSRNILEYELKLTGDFILGRMIIRPSGTEPKLKIYIEVGINPQIEIEDAITLANTKNEQISSMIKSYLLSAI